MKDLSFSLLAKLLSIFANGFVVIVLSSELSIIDFGRYTNFLNLYNLALAAATSGGIHLIIRENVQSEIILVRNKVFTLSLLIVAVFGFLLFLITVIDKLYISKSEVLLLVIFCTVSLITLVIGAGLRASGDLVWGLLLERYLRILFQAVVLAIFIYILQLDLSYSFVLYGLIVSIIMVFIAAFFITSLKDMCLTTLSKTSSYDLFRYTMYSSMMTLFTRIDLLVISIFLDFKAVAIYGLMVQLLNIFTSFEQALNPVFVKRAKEAINTTHVDFQLIHKELKLFTSIILTVGLIGAAVTFFILDEWFLKIWDPSYLPTVKLLIVAIAGRWLLSIFGYSENVAMLIGLPKHGIQLNICALVIYFLLCVITTNLFGLLGVVVLQIVAVMTVRIWRTFSVFSQTGYFPAIIHRDLF